MELRSDRLRVFRAVVDARGFSAGARALGMTQSTVSQAIAALEGDVGEPLFSRSTRSPRLTDAGKVLYEHAVRVLAEVERATVALDELRGDASGRLRLGTTDTLASYLLPPVFGAFRDQHPAVELKLVNRPSPVIAAMVASQELDVGVVSLPLPPRPAPAVESLTRILLTALKDVVITPPGHPLAMKSRLPLKALEGVPMVLLDHTTSLRAFLDARFREQRVHPHVVMEMSSIEVIKRLVALGFGVSIVPHMAVRPDDALATIAVGGVDRQRWVGMLVPANAGRATRALVDVAVRHFRATAR